MSEPARVPPENRRERRKSETRAALRQAAHRLFAEQGFAQTTIEQIVDVAGVSPRTFFRYYTSKDELLRLAVSDLLPVLQAALAARPAGEPPLAAVAAAFGRLLGPDGNPALLSSLDSPLSSLRARVSLFRTLAQWEQGIADTLLARSGIESAEADPDQRLQAVAVACAATSALRSSMQNYRLRYPGQPLTAARYHPLVELAFRALGGAG
jgi:AcrR family transcriptional regulator